MEYMKSGYQKRINKRERSYTQEDGKTAPQQISIPSRKPNIPLSRSDSRTAVISEERMKFLPEKLWDMKEVAQFFSLSQTKVFLLIREHGLPVYRIGGRNRFDPQEVWQWLQGWRKRQSL